MMYQRTLQKLTTEEFITESDDEVVAMWERNHMANHDESTDQAYMNAIQEVQSDVHGGLRGSQLSYGGYSHRDPVVQRHG